MNLNLTGRRISILSIFIFTLVIITSSSYCQSSNVTLWFGINWEYALQENFEKIEVNEDKFIFRLHTTTYPDRVEDLYNYVSNPNNTNGLNVWFINNDNMLLVPDSTFSFEDGKILFSKLNKEYIVDFNPYLTLNIKEDVGFDFAIFPNPVFDYLTIDLVDISLANPKVSIYSVNGEVLYENAIAQNEKINLTDYPKGIYFVRINDVIRKVVKR